MLPVTAVSDRASPAKGALLPRADDPGSGEGAANLAVGPLPHRPAEWGGAWRRGNVHRKTSV